MTTSTESETPAQSWERALDELEAFSRLTEAQLQTAQPMQAEQWSVPDLVPMPAELADRARELLTRQQQLLDLLPTALEKVRQQRTVTERFSQTSRRGHDSVPVYIDHTA